MDDVFNFRLSDKEPLSKVCVQRMLYEFKDVCNYVRQLPYGRNSNPEDFSLILSEQKGTCSTKHAFLGQVLLENNIQDMYPCIGVYRMNANNTKGVGPILKSYDLVYLPEAHMYLKHNKDIYDFTRIARSKNSFENDILYEERILPNQIGSYKLKLHQDYLKKWIKTHAIPYSFDTIWDIREQCIEALSQ